MRRLKGFGAALAVAALFLLAGGGTVLAAGTPDFVGQWTPDGSSNAQLAGHAFHIQTADQSSARAAASEYTPSFDQYCSSGATYFILSYTWGAASTMGGCVSGSTKGHVYVWGTHNDVAYVRPITLKGEQILGGGWGLAGQGGNVNYEKLKAHHPAAKLQASVKVSSGKKKHSTVTSFTGSGSLHMASPPGDCVATPVLSGSIPFVVRVTKKGSHPASFKIGLGSGSGSYESCGSQGTVSGVPVVVKTTDLWAKKFCSMGATGQLSMTDKAGGDALTLSIPGCHVSIKATQAKKGSKVTVGVTFNDKGY